MSLEYVVSSYLVGPLWSYQSQDEFRIHFWWLKEVFRKNWSPRKLYILILGQPSFSFFTHFIWKTMARIVRSEHKRSFIIDRSSKASLSLMILKVQDIKEKASQIMLLCTLSHIHALELNYNYPNIKFWEFIHVWSSSWRIKKS